MALLAGAVLMFSRDGPNCEVTPCETPPVRVGTNSGDAERLDRRFRRSRMGAGACSVGPTAAGRTPVAGSRESSVATVMGENCKKNLLALCQKIFDLCVIDFRITADG